MELAELQSVWSFVTADIEQKDLVDERTVAQTMHKRSKAELANIKRAMHYKFIFGGVTGIICAGSAIASVLVPEHFHPLDVIFGTTETIIFYTTLAIALFTMLWFNHRAYQQIYQVQNGAGDLRSSLGQFIEVMEEAIRFNIYSDTFMSPVFFTWFYYAYAFRDHPLAWDLRTLVLMLFPFAVGIFSFFVQRYLQHLKFGRYLDRLKTYLQALEPKKNR